jgi:hypothetical protein
MRRASGNHGSHAFVEGVALCKRKFREAGSAASFHRATSVSPLIESPLSATGLPYGRICATCLRRTERGQA